MARATTEHAQVVVKAGLSFLGGQLSIFAKLVGNGCGVSGGGLRFFGLLVFVKLVVLVAVVEFVTARSLIFLVVGFVAFVVGFVVIVGGLYHASVIPARIRWNYFWQSPLPKLPFQGPFIPAEWSHSRFGTGMVPEWTGTESGRMHFACIINDQCTPHLGCFCPIGVSTGH